MAFTNTSLIRASLLSLVLLVTSSAHAEVGTITTIVGNGTEGYCGDDVPALDACMFWPSSVAIDAAGNLFIGDYFNHRVRKVDACSGLISTVAGNGERGYSGDAGPATDAQLAGSGFIAIDLAGNLFISDVFNNRVRRVDASTGVITAFAGTGEFGFSGDGGPATDAELYYPIASAVDTSGNLYFPDQLNDRVRRVDAATNIITTVAGNGTRGYCGDGGPATSACLDRPHGVALDSAGNLCIADLYNYRIRCVDVSTGEIATVAGIGFPLYFGDGGPATSAGIGRPAALAFDAADNMFIPDYEYHVVRRVDAASRVISTVAGSGEAGFSGDGGPATEAHLKFPMGVAVDAAGNLLIADQENDLIRRVEHIAAGVDTDGDGLTDPFDNCIDIANGDQRDTDGDGFGNMCDADLNGDIVVNNLDLGLMKALFFTADPDADFDGNGSVNFFDLGIMKALFFQAPGPSGVIDDCDDS